MHEDKETGELTIHPPKWLQSLYGWKGGDKLAVINPKYSQLSIINLSAEPKLAQLCQESRIKIKHQTEDAAVRYWYNRIYKKDARAKKITLNYLRGCSLKQLQYLAEKVEVKEIRNTLIKHNIDRSIKFKEHFNKVKSKLNSDRKYKET